MLSPRILRRSVREDLHKFIKRTQADEFMIITQIVDHVAGMRDSNLAFGRQLSIDHYNFSTSVAAQHASLLSAAIADVR